MINDQYPMNNENANKTYLKFCIPFSSFLWKQESRICFANTFLDFRLLGNDRNHRSVLEEILKISV